MDNSAWSIDFGYIVVDSSALVNLAEGQYQEVNGFGSTQQFYPIRVVVGGHDEGYARGSTDLEGWRAKIAGKRLGTNDAKDEPFHDIGSLFENQSESQLLEYLTVAAICQGLNKGGELDQASHGLANVFFSLMGCR